MLSRWCLLLHVLTVFQCVLLSFPITKASLSPSPSSFVFTDHFHPQYHPGPLKNWMNDPNGPMYYDGYYHLFFQYNPYGSVWGSMSWGHIISKDLALWEELPVILYPDQDYDKGGVFSGSITIRGDGTPVIIYTCVASDNTERQCLAFPSNASDPLLTKWYKSPNNPIINNPPQGVDSKQFRDPTTAWIVNGTYLIAVGAELNGVGSVVTYSTDDFHTWTPTGTLWTNSRYGNMFECPDFFRIGQNQNITVYFMKVSAKGQDYYSLGSFDSARISYTPMTTPIVLDAGNVYASKSFYDPNLERHIWYGWSAETDPNAQRRGWQGCQTLPRELTYDAQHNIVRQIPVSALSKLRTDTLRYAGSLSSPSDVVISHANPTHSQCELNITFHPKDVTQPTHVGVDVLRKADGSQKTSIHLQYTPPSLCLCENINVTTSASAWLWIDRSQTGGPGDHSIQRTSIALNPDEALNHLSLHIWIDHSIIESFALDGMVGITSRVYPDLDATDIAIFVAQPQTFEEQPTCDCSNETEDISSQAVGVEATVWSIASAWNASDVL